MGQGNGERVGFKAWTLGTRWGLGLAQKRHLFGVGQGTGDRVGFRVTLGTGRELGDTSLGFCGGTREWGGGGVQGLDTEDRVEVISSVK